MHLPHLPTYVDLLMDTSSVIYPRVGCAATRLRNLEDSRDHGRIEQMFFDAASPRKGILYPQLSRFGLGLELKRADAENYRVR